MVTYFVGYLVQINKIEEKNRKKSVHIKFL